MSKIKLNKGLTLKSLSAAVMAICAGASTGVYAQDATEEELVVTGFRSSLAAALNTKKESNGFVDAILAEDIADFPDQNLAESLQRIPGVAISRSNGEGRQITVRGLGGLYTKTRINGMEARAAHNGNNTRAFDFNVFASELFNRVIVRKSASADVEEGSLGATVDLHTGRAFDYDEGHTFLVSGAGQYNDLSEEISPRLTMLYSFNDPEGRFGVTSSVAYSELNTLVTRANTVRWQKAGFNSVNGEDCSGTSAACAEVEDAFHARIPRYGETELARERLGMTFGAQFAPAEGTEINFDALVARYDEIEEFRTIEILFRGNEGGMDVTDYTIESFPDRTDFRSDAAGVPFGNDTITSMSVDNAWARSERFHGDNFSRFSQYTLSIDHEVTDSFKVSALAGKSKASADRPHRTTLMYDNRAYDGFTYDYRGSASEPILTYGGQDVTQGSTFTLTDLRDTKETADTENNVIEFNAEWTLSDAVVLSAGYNQRTFSMDATDFTRNGSTCGYGYVDCSEGAIGITGRQDLSENFSYSGAAGPGSTTEWVVPSLDWIDEIGFFDEPLRIDQGGTRNVTEDISGYFLKIAGDLDLGSMRLAYDAGIRYAETDQTSAGYNSGQWVEIRRPKYDHTLPSLNTSLWLTEDLALKFSWAETIARSSLGNLSPGGSVDTFGTATVRSNNPFLNPSESTNIDLALEWYFADGALLAAGYFEKDVDSFPTRETLFNQTYASTGLPVELIEVTSPWRADPEGPEGFTCSPLRGGNGCWEISAIVQGEGATIKGFEVAFEAPFDVFGDLPPILRNMGLQANYTSVDSETNYTYLGQDLRERLQNLSETSYNFTLYYENDSFSARVSSAHRSDYINNGSADRNRNLYQFVEPATYWDFSSSYDFTENFSMSLEVINMLDQEFEVTVDIDANRPESYNLTGRNILLGARYRF
jgi:iron complex outermembrane receptor protein